MVVTASSKEVLLVKVLCGIHLLHKGLDWGWVQVCEDVGRVVIHWEGCVDRVLLDSIEECVLDLFSVLVELGRVYIASNSEGLCGWRRVCQVVEVEGIERGISQVDHVEGQVVWGEVVLNSYNSIIISIDWSSIERHIEVGAHIIKYSWGTHVTKYLGYKERLVFLEIINNI